VSVFLFFETNSDQFHLLFKALESADTFGVQIRGKVLGLKSVTQILEDLGDIYNMAINDGIEVTPLS